MRTIKTLESERRTRRNAVSEIRDVARDQIKRARKQKKSFDKTFGDMAVKGSSRKKFEEKKDIIKAVKKSAIKQAREGNVY
jgi:hypothetical protein